MAGRESNWLNRLQHVALTDIGMRRAKNQDSLTVVLASDMDEWHSRGHFFMVADGMGAHAAGELASKIAVDGVPHLYRKYTELSPPEALQRAVLETNSEVYRRGQANSDFRAMGTTASALVLLPQGALLGHIGDSRVYRVRNGKLEQLTRDHSLVWELREAGLENAESANQVPKNVITRSLGPNANVQVDIEGPFPVDVDDTFLLCSDGLMARVEDEEIAAILANLPPADAGRLLVDLANLRGGPDNITVILVKVLTSDFATSGTDAKPLKIGQERPDPKRDLMFVVAVAVCVLAALLLAVSGNAPAALIALAAGAVLATTALALRARSAAKGVELGTGRKLGAAPYTSTDCPAPDDVARSLTAITDELRSAPAALKFGIDWTEFDALRQSSSQALKNAIHGQAIQEAAQAVSLLMQQVREAKNKNASDSAIEL